MAVVYPGQSGHNADKAGARSHRAGDEYGIHSQEVPAGSAMPSYPGMKASEED